MFAALVAIVALFPVSAFADDEIPHYATWEEAQPVYFPDSTSTNMNEVAYAIDLCMQAGLQNYEAGNMDAAYKCMQDGYYGYYEVCGFERQTMSRISGARKNEIELLYKACRQSVKKDQGIEVAKANVEELTTKLYEDALLLSPTTEAFEKLTGSASGGTKVTSGAFFLEAFIILLREGLEAILVIGGIIAYLVKSGNKNKLKPVYIGSVVAIACSALAAWILGILKAKSSMFGASQEVIEGVTALLAVAVLFYVSNWMLKKSETETWNRYINDKVEGSVSKGSMFALGFTAFLAVFREGAEVILFCQQYFSRAGSMEHGYLAVFGGVVAGAVAVAIVFILIRVLGVKIPLKPFFMATSILMAVMSIAFLGSGMWELFLDGGLAERIGGWAQSLAGTIPSLSWMSGNDTLAFFGIYPTWITLGPQIILTIVTVITFVLTIGKGKKTAKKTEEAQA